MARSRKERCTRGHEIARVGRYSSGRCRACALGKDEPPVYEPWSNGPRRKERCLRGHTRTPDNVTAMGACRECIRLRARSGRPNGRPRVELCANGHELTPENRYLWRGKQKGCLTCRRSNSDNYRRRAGKGRHVPRVVPSEPIWGFVERIGVKEFAQGAGARLGIQPASVERLLFRARTTGFTVDTADDLCVAIGRHPVEVFGPAWFTYGAKEVADAV